MKYANIMFHGKTKCNIGDNLQLLAIDKLYDYMGLSPNDIIRIPYEELGTYKSKDGNPVILPINFPFLEYKEKGESERFSKDIIPVYLGCVLQKPELSEDEISFFERLQPIGCRDEYTFNLLKNNNINSWLNGCMSLCCFDYSLVKGSNTYIVDLDSEKLISSLKIQ